MKALNLLLLSLAVSACSVGYNPRYYYNNVVIANLTGDSIVNLKVQVGAQGRTVECDEVTNKRQCEDRFGKIPYPQDLVDISWKTSAGEQISRQVTPSIPLTLLPQGRATFG